MIQRSWFWFALFLNIVGSYFKVMDFSEIDVVGYSMFSLLLLLGVFFTRKQSFFSRIQQVVLLLFLILHGLISLTLPIGIVFALTGSYWLALKVFVTFYLPSIMLVWINLYGLYILEKERKKATTLP